MDSPDDTVHRADAGTADTVEIAPGLHRIRVPSDRAHLLNCYALIDGNDVTVIDTGWPDSAELITAALQSLGRRSEDITRIVLTHFHDDHAGSAAELAARSGAEVVAGHPDAAVVRGTRPGPPAILTDIELTMHPPMGEHADSPPPCRIDVEAEDGDVLDFGGGARVLAVPGHTPGSIALHLPALDTVLTGDVVAEFHGEVIRGAFHVDREVVRRSVGLIAATGAGVAGFGHGEAVTVDASTRIAAATDPLA